MVFWSNSATFVDPLTAMRMKSSWKGAVVFFTDVSDLLRVHSVPLVFASVVVLLRTRMISGKLRFSLAKNSDAVISIVGLNADWETEGHDRTTLDLPGRTDELVQNLTAVNPKLVVVNQSVSWCRSLAFFQVI